MVSIDIQAILTVIARRKYYLNNGEYFALDLQSTFLQNGDMHFAHLEGANLSKANLFVANLSKANLSKANLSGAILSGANLSGAILSEANLSGATLLGVELERAENLTINQLSKVKTLYEAKLDEELEKPLREKYPALFEEPKR